MMSFTDAAERILRDARKPLKYVDIWNRAVRGKLVASAGVTPHITMYVSIKTDIERRRQRGEPQRFVFLGKGMFSLVEVESGVPGGKAKSVLQQLRGSRAEAGQELYKRLTAKNNGDGFERMVADLLIKMGYQSVTIIGGKDDQGVDIICERREGIALAKIAVQCKCKSLASKIGPKDVSTLRDNISSYQCQQGVLITTSELNVEAKAKAKEPGKEPIHTIEHGEILDLFAEHGVGMRAETVSYYQVDAAQYEFLKQ